MKIEILTHFASDDPKCSGDYASVNLVVDGKEVACWGDDYHDKGAEKAEAFVEGIVWSKKPLKVEIVRTQIADYNS